MHTLLYANTTNNTLVLHATKFVNFYQLATFATINSAHLIQIKHCNNCKYYSRKAQFSGSLKVNGPQHQKKYNKKPQYYYLPQMPLTTSQ